MARLPQGDAAPADGALPKGALAELANTPLGLYLHVPYCTSRCGYCDFNTYVAGEDGGSQDGYLDGVRRELALARRILGDDIPPLATVFVGGGTPTILPAEDLSAIVHEIEETFGLAPDAELTTEANPESVDTPKLEALRAAGFTRISIGMQSASPAVLSALDRVHTPGRAVEAAREARAAGFEQVSLDLIYGTPGESAAEWDQSLAAALSAGPDHISTYSLIVESGTRLAARVARGELVVPQDEVIVERFETAERVLAAAGMHWYETCSWARDAAARCHHNLGYWSGGNWWGVGPGAHSHVGGVRWWNVLHPRAWGAHLASGRSPAAGREIPDPEATRLEQVMLGLRLRTGIELDRLTAAGRDAAVRQLELGMLEPEEHAAGRAVLTLRGRLMADPVTIELAG